VELVLVGGDMITVVSTGYKARTKSDCIDSVKMQRMPVDHRYVEASEQDPPLTVTENVWLMCKELPPNEIVIWLDGDDRLASNNVAEIVLSKYAAGADCTYGSFRFSDGRVPTLRAYDNYRNCRREPWLGTHLKTFRAGLLQQVPAERLQLNGEWINMACDIAIMFEVLERAKNAVFVPDVLCVYNYSMSWEFRFSPAEAAREKQIVRELRSR
jgi:hypothetical protein